jgi:hypothetical protein
VLQMTAGIQKGASADDVGVRNVVTKHAFLWKDITSIYRCRRLSNFYYSLSVFTVSGCARHQRFCWMHSLGKSKPAWWVKFAYTYITWRNGRFLFIHFGTNSDTRVNRKISTIFWAQELNTLTVTQLQVIVSLSQHQLSVLKHNAVLMEVCCCE